MKISLIIILILGYCHLSILDALSSWMDKGLSEFKSGLKLKESDFGEDDMKQYKQWLFRQDLSSLWAKIPK